MSNILLTVGELEDLKPTQIVQNEKVRKRFIQIYDTLWGGERGEAVYERESIFFNKILSADERLLAATKFSIFTAFIDLAINGLSLEPGARALCYLMIRNFKVGESVGSDGKSRSTYESRIVLSVSGYGELVLRACNGQIRYADNPVIVYEGDEFSFTDIGGQKTVSYTCRLPHDNKKIVAAFMRIVRPDGSNDYAVMYPEDWSRLESYSAKQNKKWNAQTRQYENSANPLYTSNNGGIDTGFLIAKLIKHAFKSYPKVRIGKGTELETEQADEPTSIEDMYGVEDAKGQFADQQKEAQPYGNPPDMSAGVTVDPQHAQEDDGAF